jgi:phosphate transport system permease protein
MATRDTSLAVTTEESEVSRAKGLAFEGVCLAATSFALVSVLVLLLFVAVDAFAPATADAGWLGVYALAVVVPLLVLVGHYYRLEDPAGEVAYATTGLPVVGLLLGGGFIVIFAELLSVTEWFALVLATAVAAGAIWGHARLRPQAALERLGVILLAPIVAIYGLPPVEVVTLVNSLGLGVQIPTRIVSLREVVLGLPVLPASWLLLLATLTVPVAAVFGHLVAQRRDSRRDGLVLLGGSVGLAAIGFGLGPLVGIGAVPWIVLVTFILPPLGTYVEGVLRRDEGVHGLAFPVVLVAGLGLASVLVGTLGFQGPETWLDWQFLTSSPSFDPELAGFYPPIVGSIMMLIVIIVSMFPIGVGAAVYLEEYAPSSGRGGQFIELIEINISNLAGVPSVVYGLLGLALFIRFANMPGGSVIVGALAVGLLILPIVIISAREAIRAVPDSDRQAAYGMGATRWQTVRTVVLPQAMPGILTGTILALGRAIGETAPLLMVGVAATVPLAPNSFVDKLPAMPRQLFTWAFEIDPAFRHGVLAAGVVTLLAVMLLMNATAIVIRNKYQRQA